MDATADVGVGNFKNLLAVLKQTRLTVGDLIDELQKLDPALPVITQAPPDGKTVQGDWPLWSASLVSEIDVFAMKNGGLYTHESRGEETPDVARVCFIY